MNKIKIKEPLIFCLPRLALLLYAILPVTENKDWVFYTCAIFILISFLIFFVSVVIAYRKDRKNIKTYICGTPHDNLFDMFISLAGIIVCYSIDIPNRAIFWLFLLIMAIFQILYPTKRFEKN